MEMSESGLLDNLKARAERLVNGHRDDIKLMGEVISEMAIVLVNTRKTQNEIEGKLVELLCKLEKLHEYGCARRCGLTWPAAAAIATGVLGAIGTLFGILAMFSG
jgi:hypothetical protein